MYISWNEYLNLIVNWLIRVLGQTVVNETIKTIQNQEIDVIMFILKITSVYNSVFIFMFISLMFASFI